MTKICLKSLPRTTTDQWLTTVTKPNSARSSIKEPVRKGE
ncbi:hypothetical protein LINPERHAP2_LOCUS10011, partial [Linum perenne]